MNISQEPMTDAEIRRLEELVYADDEVLEPELPPQWYERKQRSSICLVALVVMLSVNLAMLGIVLCSWL